MKMCTSFFVNFYSKLKCRQHASPTPVVKETHFLYYISVFTISPSTCYIVFLFPLEHVFGELYRTRRPAIRVEGPP